MNEIKDDDIEDLYMNEWLEYGIVREWVGLTDDEFLEACQLAERGNYLVAFKRIQQILKAKND